MSKGVKLKNQGLIKNKKQQRTEILQNVLQTSPFFKSKAFSKMCLPQKDIISLICFSIRILIFNGKIR